MTFAIESNGSWIIVYRHGVDYSHWHLLHIHLLGAKVDSFANYSLLGEDNSYSGVKAAACSHSLALSRVTWDKDI